MKTPKFCLLLIGLFCQCMLVHGGGDRNQIKEESFEKAGSSSSQARNSDFENLPFEVLLYAFKESSNNDLISLESCSRSCRLVAEEIFKMRQQISIPIISPRKGTTNWKINYYFRDLMFKAYHKEFTFDKSNERQFLRFANFCQDHDHPRLNTQIKKRVKSIADNEKNFLDELNDYFHQKISKFRRIKKFSQRLNNFIQYPTRLFFREQNVDFDEETIISAFNYSLKAYKNLLSLNQRINDENFKYPDEIISSLIYSVFVLEEMFYNCLDKTREEIVLFYYINEIFSLDYFNFMIDILLNVEDLDKNEGATAAIEFYILLAQNMLAINSFSSKEKFDQDLSLYIKELSLSKVLTIEDKEWKKHVLNFGDYKVNAKSFDDLTTYGKVLEEYAQSLKDKSQEDEINFLRQARHYYQLVLKNQQDILATQGLVRIEAALDMYHLAS